MLWAKIYLIVLLALSAIGLLIDSRKRRTPAELAINIIACIAPALLVLAYLRPGLLTYSWSVLTLIGITLGSNLVSAKMYLREWNAEEEFEEAEVNFWSMMIGTLIILGPAIWYGALAAMRA